MQYSVVGEGTEKSPTVKDVVTSNMSCFLRSALAKTNNDESVELAIQAD